MKRAAKKEKDPNMPKRATTAFFFFSQDKRSSVTKVHPDYKVSQVAQELGKMWKLLTPTERKKYDDLAAGDRKRYEKEMTAFKAGKPITKNAAAAPSKKGAGKAKAASPKKQRKEESGSEDEDEDGSGTDSDE